MAQHFDHTIRVRYSEIDRMGWVYHSHYLTWFEVGRTEFIRSKGLSYREIEERGYLLPLVRADLQLRRPARYDDLLTIRTRVGDIASRRIVFDYQILRDGQALSSGTSTHVCTEASGKTVVIPDFVRELLG